MIPSTLLGLLVFAASIGPGYIYVRIAERYKLRATRSALLETAELLSVGGFTSIVSLLAWAFLADWIHLLDVQAALAGGSDYLADHPTRVLTFLALTLLTSYGLAWLAAKRMHRKLPAAITIGSVWHSQIGDAGATRYVFATAELRDGRSIYGQVVSFTLDEVEEERQVAFGLPLRVKPKGGDWEHFPQLDRIIVNGADILLLSVMYRPVKT